MLIKESQYRRYSTEITSPHIVTLTFVQILKAEHKTDQDKEHFWVVGLSTRNQVKYLELVSLGTLNKSLASPREVFRLAIMKAANALILVHNHPSGNPEPSSEDINLTRRLTDAGRILGIEILDHVIIGNRGNYMSFKDKRLI